MSVYLPGRYIKGRWERRDFDEYPYNHGYPLDDEVEPTLSWRIAEAWKVFRGKPAFQERITAEAPKMYRLLKNIAFYINEINKLRPLPSELMTYARRAEALLERIGGKDD